MSKNTINTRACNQVAGFKSMGEEFVRKLVINGKAKSTHENYLRQMAKMSLYFGRTPLELSQADLEEYLYHLIQKDSDSLSSFKHLVYGLRKLYLLFDKEELHLSLPSINRPNKLPVVLSAVETRRLLKAPEHLWERILLALIYDTGLRIQELIDLYISDVDLDRQQVHVRQSKNHKDRYIPMSVHAVRGLKKHLALRNPKDYLFEHPKRRGIPMNQTGIRKLLKEAVEKANIKKDICVHSLRHTYATHQLEAGQNIMTVRDLLGHSCVSTTFMYLHIAQLDTVKAFGCMEALYRKGSE
jgi:integrase/recombinase XerD